MTYSWSNHHSFLYGSGLVTIEEYYGAGVAVIWPRSPINFLVRQERLVRNITLILYRKGSKIL